MITANPALARFVTAVRTLMEQTISLNADEEKLDQLSLMLEQVVDEITPHTDTSISRFNAAHLANKINECMPYNPISGFYNPLAPSIDFFRDNEKLIAEAYFSRIYEGPPDSIHGGFIAGVYDQVLATGALIHGVGGPTAYLNINYKQLHPLEKPLRFSAYLKRVEGRKLYVAGDCYDGDQLLSHADALFIKMDF